jgi:hypothetical protein
MTDAHARLREVDKQLELAARDLDECDVETVEAMRHKLRGIVGFRPASEVGQR